MRVFAAAAGTPEPTHRDVLAPAAPSSAATCALFLATLSGSCAPIGSLALQLDAGFPFAVTASSLRLPASDADETADIARQLLWHASRELPELRAGAALLARPASRADVPTLERFGFAAARVEQEDAMDPLLALVRRRDLGEASGFSHATLRVSSMPRSLQFWSLLHYSPVRVFTTNGARAAWLSAAWSPLSVELIEIPESMLCQETAAPQPASGLGPAHLCLDVTPLGVSLSSTLEVLQQRSVALFGRTLRVLTPPHQQMMGDLVADVAIVRSPDGAELRLTRSTCILDVNGTEPDWTIDTLACSS
jgi:hypothetical protein